MRQTRVNEIEALQDFAEAAELDAIRTKRANAAHRAFRDEVRKLPKRHALIGNCIAPGVDVLRYLA